MKYVMVAESGAELFEHPRGAGAGGGQTTVVTGGYSEGVVLDAMPCPRRKQLTLSTPAPISKQSSLPSRRITPAAPPFRSPLASLRQAPQHPSPPRARLLKARQLLQRPLAFQVMNANVFAKNSWLL